MFRRCCLHPVSTIPSLWSLFWQIKSAFPIPPQLLPVSLRSEMPQIDRAATQVIPGRRCSSQHCSAPAVQVTTVPVETWWTELPKQTLEYSVEPDETTSGYLSHLWLDCALWRQLPGLQDALAAGFDLPGAVQTASMTILHVMLAIQKRGQPRRVVTRVYPTTDRFYRFLGELARKTPLDHPRGMQKKEGQGNRSFGSGSRGCFPDSIQLPRRVGSRCSPTR